MLDDFYINIKKDMNSIVKSYKQYLMKIRAGKLNASLIEDLKITYNNNIMILKHIAFIKNINFTTLLVKPWDLIMIPFIEKSIIMANMDLLLTINNDGLWISIPNMNEEQRKKYVKQIKTKSENIKIMIRNVRRKSNEKYKILIKEHSFSLDVEKRGLKKIQKFTDDYIINVDKLLNDKKKEIMTV